MRAWNFHSLIHLSCKRGALWTAARTSPLFHNEHVQIIPMPCVWMLLLNAGRLTINSEETMQEYQWKRYEKKTAPRSVNKNEWKILSVRFCFKNPFSCSIRMRLSFLESRNFTSLYFLSRRRLCFTVTWTIRYAEKVKEASRFRFFSTWRNNAH